jgi:hypothetical protein
VRKSISRLHDCTSVPASASVHRCTSVFFKPHPVGYSYTHTGGLVSRKPDLKQTPQSPFYLTPFRSTINCDDHFSLQYILDLLRNNINLDSLSSMWFVCVFSQANSLGFGGWLR